MRLLSVFIAAAMVMFGLAGMAALDGAAAQEKSAQQTLQSREIKGYPGAYASDAHSRAKRQRRPGKYRLPWCRDYRYHRPHRR